MTQLVNNTKRFFRYYFAKNKALFMQLAVYKADIVMVILGNYGYTFMMLFFFDVLFKNINSVAGWTKYEVLIMFSVGQLILILQWAFFGSVDRHIRNIIADGTMDLFLTKPVNALANVISYNFTFFENLPGFALTIAILVVSMARASVYLNLWYVILLAFMIVVGTFMMTFTKLVISLLAFWLTDTKNIMRVHYHIFYYIEYPLEIYPKGFRALISTILPFGIVAYIPARIIIRGFDLGLFSLYMGVFVFYLLVNLFIWNKGTKAYSSASS